MRHRIVENFAPQAHALRTHFEERFAEPRKATASRFVWDFWCVENQYTALRTPAWEYFPSKLYDAFHQHLVWWGRKTLGCHDVSPPWLSCYINGCEQRLHGDLPHGPLAFVFSLTPWDKRTFRGGETLLLQDEVLDFWTGFVSTRAMEEPHIQEEIPARFNRLTVFDPRIPHGVRRVDGSMDPRQGRLVIHGWFVQPRPFIEGPLQPRSLEEAIERISAAVMHRFSAGLEHAGLLSWRLTVDTHGKVTKVSLLVDTLRSPAHAAAERTALKALISRTLKNHRFPAHRKPSQITLPLVFER